jgi:hypothetical protein
MARRMQLLLQLLHLRKHYELKLQEVQRGANETSDGLITAVLSVVVVEDIQIGYDFEHNLFKVFVKSAGR